MKISKQNLFLYSFFYLSPFADALNGALIFNNIIPTNGLFSPTQIFRFFIMILSFSFMKSKKLMIIVFMTSYIIFIEGISFFNYLDIKGLMLGVIYANKIIYMILIMFTIRSIIEKEGILLIIKFFRDSTLIYALILLVSTLLGIHESTYGYGAFGSKGLFASGNGLSVFLGIGTMVSYYWYRLYPYFNNLVISYMILIATVLISTKASIVFLLLFLFLQYWYAKPKIKILLLIFFSLFFIYFHEYIFSTLTSLFDVIVYRFKERESLFTFLLSGRQNYISNALNVYDLSGIRILRLFFGAGVFVSFQDFSQVNIEYKTMENDFFDVFFYFGLIGLFLYLCFIMIGYYKLYKQKNIILFFSWSAIVFYSIVAGHVLFNGMSNVALVILFLTVNYHKNKINDNMKLKF